MVRDDNISQYTVYKKKGENNGERPACIVLFNIIK
jgi:hypothetical protein